MNFEEIRRTVIVAMFSDDVIMDLVVLKGGNALNIVHRLGGRTSIDVDFSIPGDFSDPDDAQVRIHRALSDRFDSAGYRLFDFSFKRRPKDPERRDDRWGGYRIEFKLVPAVQAGVVNADLALARRSALEVGPGQARVFRVDISKYEYCDAKVPSILDGYEIFVYPPFLVAIEKLRALCQQLPEYVGRRKATARARDFYDIHAIVTDAEYRPPENMATELRRVFDAKEVSLDLLLLLRDSREFHRGDWRSVLDALSVSAQPFDFYFEFVVDWAASIRNLSE
jgi:hypothetical protein